MRRTSTASRTFASPLAKSPSGIQGLDEITGGGLPHGRTTLVCGGAGCGKTLFALEFLVRGVTDHGEPGVLLTFEETAAEITQNVRSLGFDLDDLAASGKLVIDHVHVERSEIEETGAYNLDGLFIRLGLAVDAVKAKRVVLDTIEALFAGFSDQAVLRAELRRLFRWLKERRLTAVITGERGDGALTRQGLEEYVSDCVILLDHRVEHQISTRFLRVVKYRGTAHGTNEYPFLIDARGIEVLPITSLNLDHPVSSERVSTGVPRLDAMLGGKGYYRGSSVLISGTTGSGKTSLAGTIVDAACRRGERCLYAAFEESPPQIKRNLSSIGLQLEPWVKKGLLHFHATRPTLQGLEAHLTTLHRLVRDVQPRTVVIDPISNLLSAGAANEAHAMLMRLLDLLKSQQITAILVSLTSGGAFLEMTEIGISSLIDTWILLRDSESNGERNRLMYVLKSRGMAHSNQLREFRLTNQGIDLLDVYVGAEGVLTGSARQAQEAKLADAALERQQAAERRRCELERLREALEAQVAALRAEFAAREVGFTQLSVQDQAREKHWSDELRRLSQSREMGLAVDLRGRKGEGGRP